MRPYLALSFLLVAAVPAQADTSASFDCARAATLVEKTICDDANYLLAYRDGMLGRLYADLKQAGGHEDALGGQKAWLRTRDACKADVDCLIKAYDLRIAELAQAGGDTAGLTGTYHYKNDEFESDGELWLFREIDGSLTGRIQTVTGPSVHTCDLEFDRAAPSSGGWTWIDTDDDGEGNRCTVRFLGGSGRFGISSESCSIYCGVAGYFDDVYARAR